MKSTKEMMKLYAVTDRTWVRGRSLLEQVELALKGGVTCVQLREKELDKDNFLEEAREMKKLCKSYNVPFIINDDVRVAILSNADGIHVGQSDMEARNVREMVGQEMVIGVSVQTVEQAIKAKEAGADYLGVGAVFNTSTKLDADITSHDTLKAICSEVDIPVVAIGGIDKGNILDLSHTGVDGVALISAIFAVNDIEKECRILRKLSEEMINR